MNHKIAEFEIGDKVIKVLETGHHCASIGETGIVESNGVRLDKSKDICDGWGEFKLLKNKYKNNNMSLKDKFALLLKGEPEKSFVKAGITDADDTLTDEGSTVFLSWLLKKNGEAFKKEVVDELLKKDKDEE